MSSVVYTEDLRGELLNVLSDLKPDRVVMVCDEAVADRFCADVASELCDERYLYVVRGGERAKTLEGARAIWDLLEEAGATRSSVVLNAGGGVTTDLGGFAASTYKRGIRFVNIPTTVLGAADAAIGGKTGVNYAGLKNEIGVFAHAERVIVSPQTFTTLPRVQINSGMAEVVKMAMLTDAEWYEELLNKDSWEDLGMIARHVYRAAKEKERIVEQDFRESGLRRILNLGHTRGHAYESLAIRRGIEMSHGEAVAHGILYALEESADILGFPKSRIDEYREKVLNAHFNSLPFIETDKMALDSLMLHDKKMVSPGVLNMVLLRNLGEPEIIQLRKCR